MTYQKVEFENLICSFFLSTGQDYMDDYINSIDFGQEINEEDDLTYINKKGQAVTLEFKSKGCCQPVRRVCKEYGKRKKNVRCKVIKGRKCCGSKSDKCSCAKLKSHFKRMASKTLKKINRMNIIKRKRKKKKKQDKSVTKTGGLRKHSLKRRVRTSKELSSQLFGLVQQTKVQGKNPNPKCSSKSDLRYNSFHMITS